MDMDLQINQVDQLEGALTSKDISRRAEILRRVTDLFVVGSGKFSEDQVELCISADNEVAGRDRSVLGSRCYALIVFRRGAPTPIGVASI